MNWCNMIRNNALIIYLLVLVSCFALVMPGCKPSENLSTSSATGTSTVQSPSNTRNYQKYVNSQYGYSVQYPADWVATEGYLGGVTFWGPELADNYTVNMTIFAWSLPGYKLSTLDDFVSWRKLQISNSIDNVKYINEQQIYVDGAPAKLITISVGLISNNVESKLEDKVVLFVKDSIGYSITLDSTQAFTEKYINDFNKAVTSFKFNAE